MERIARATLKELGLPKAELTIAAIDGNPGHWRISIRGRPQEMLYEVVDRYHQGEELRTVEYHVLKVGDRYGFLFGNGLIANFLDAYYATGRPSPVMGAKILLKGITSGIFGGSFKKNLMHPCLAP